MAARILLVVVLFLGLAAGRADAATPRDFFGVIADGPALGTDGGLGAQAAPIARSGVRTIRVAAYWSDLEPRDGDLRLASFDALVLSAARQGISVMPVVHRTPTWAAAQPTVVSSQPRDAGSYARFLTALVARYGPKGSLWAEHPEAKRTPVRRWQVWNEPDLQKFWAVEGDWVPSYVGLLKPAYAALHRADPGAVVVSAGLTNKSWVGLRRLYAAGARKHFDVAAIHPFSRDVANVVKLVSWGRREMRRAGDATKPLLLSEVSWSSALGKATLNYGWELTEAGQAQRIREALPALAAQRKKLNIAGIYWYTWLSQAVGSPYSFEYSGLRRLTATGTPVDKPALRAWRETVAKLTR